MRPWIKWAGALVLAGVVVLAFLGGGRSTSEQSTTRTVATRESRPGSGTAGGSVDSSSRRPRLPAARRMSEVPLGDSAGQDPRSAATESAFPTLDVEAVLASLPAPTAESQQLVRTLSRLEQAGRPLTREEADQWKAGYERLLGGGVGSVAAVQEFLKQNTDVEFPSALKNALGFRSARAAMFDALARIGGTEATAVSVHALQTTGEAREIGQLARNLEALAPGQFGGEAVEAARHVLELAKSGGLEGQDVGPAFEVLQKHGDPSVIADLEASSKQWKYYSAIALAGLPDGAGVPTLIRQVEAQGTDTSGLREPALRMLATLSADNAEARAALVAAAKSDRISPYSWLAMSTLLAGDQIQVTASAYDTVPVPGMPLDQTSTHIRSGNQNFRTVVPPGGLTEEQAAQRTALIDELAAVTSSPKGLEVLRQAKAAVERRRRPQGPQGGTP